MTRTKLIGMRKKYPMKAAQKVTAATRNRRWGMKNMEAFAVSRRVGSLVFACLTHQSEHPLTSEARLAASPTNWKALAFGLFAGPKTSWM